MEDSFGFIYLTTCKTTGKLYIGQRKIKGNKYDHSYRGSGLLIRSSIKKHGIENFDREIIQYCNSQLEMDEAEKFWIRHFNDKYAGKMLNIALGGQYGGSPLINHPNKRDIYRRASQSHKKTLASREQPHRPMLGKRHTEQTKKKISVAKKGKKRTYEVIHTPEGRKRISESKKGKIPWNKGLKQPRPRLFCKATRSTKSKKVTPIAYTVSKKLLARTGYAGKPVASRRVREYLSSMHRNNKYCWKPIVQIDPTTLAIINTFESRDQAIKDTGATTCNVSAKSNFTRKSKKFYWMYVCDLTEWEIENKLINKKERAL